MWSSYVPESRFKTKTRWYSSQLIQGNNLKVLRVSPEKLEGGGGKCVLFQADKRFKITCYFLFIIYSELYCS